MLVYSNSRSFELWRIAVVRVLCIKSILFFIAFAFSLSLYSQEICDNAIDDDGDGLIDLNDGDCDCVTLNNDVMSLIANPSFEDMNCCPQAALQLNCANDWLDANQGSVDYWNTCGALGINVFGIGEPSMPPPDGEGYIGFFNSNINLEYVGACLLSPMIQGTTYQFEFFIGGSGSSPAFNIDFFGNPDCSSMPWGSRQCPEGEPGWIYLGQLQVPEVVGWQGVTFTFTPSQTINAFAFGGACGEAPSFPGDYYYLDGLTLNEADSFSTLSLSQFGSWCTNDIKLVATNDDSLETYQWYKDGIALIGEVEDSLLISENGYNEGEYTIVLTIDGECQSLSRQVTASTVPTAIIDIDGKCLADTIFFSDQSTINSGTIVNWEWDFGDQNSSSEQNPVHLYNSAGTYDVTLVVESDSGCTDTMSASIEVSPMPNADFSAETCFDASTSFSDQSTIDAPDNIISWNWNFDGINTSNLSNPSFSYPSSGNYDVQLIVETNNGCKDTLVQTITLNAVPTAGFTFDTVCGGTPTSFIDNSSINAGSISSYDWDFNPGVSNIVNPQNTFTTGGQYNVELVVVSDQGCRDSITYIVPVDPNPEADFNFTNVCLDLPNSFQDASTISAGSIAQWEWDFDDTYTSNISDPSHTYSSPGTYNVWLEVTTDKGCVANISHEVQVFALPMADFDFENQCLDTPMQFTDASQISIGNINSWQWNFGDTSTFSGQSPPGHSFPLADLYDVTLIVGSGACSDTIVRQVEVYPEPVVDFTFHNVCLGETNYFTDQTSLVNSNVNTWSWDFGDNTSSSLQNPSVVYDTPNTYNVKLQVETEYGCVDYASHEVIINPLPEVEFDFTEACLNEITEFTDQSDILSGYLFSWSWDFGDNITALTQNPTHTYATDGIYPVSLTVTSDSLCVDSMSHNVTVFPLPEVDFIADVTEGCQPLEVSFMDQSTVTSGIITQWNWNFGENGQAVSGQFSGNEYENEGAYTVSLTVETEKGCKNSDTINNMIIVYPLPIAGFSATPQPTTILHPVINLYDNSSPDVVHWLWDLGDGTSVELEDFEHEYQDTGTYTIVQIVENGYNCQDTAFDAIRIDGAFTFYIPNCFTPNSNRVNDGFYGQGTGIRKYTLRVFDRWGEQVFFADDPKVKWDGTMRGNTEPVQNGVFVYRVDIEDINGEEHIYNGHVTLLR